MKAFFGIFALLVNLLGYIPYIRDIILHKVKPQRITWGVWSILTTVGFANQVMNGGGWSAYFFGSTALLVTLTFVLSIRYGVGGGSKLDRAMLGLAIVLLGYWLTVHDTRLSTLLAVLIDAIGLSLTVVKTYKQPNTESYPQWVLAAGAGFFTILAVPNLDYILIIYPAYIILGNGAVVGTKYYVEHRSKRKK